MNGSHRSAGFSLMEVLIAMGIFTVGAIGVAALFPSAVHLQKQTVGAVMSSHTAESAFSAISHRKFVAYEHPGPGSPANTAGIDWWSECPDNQVSPLPIQARNAWPITERSYPSIEPDSSRRDVYWVPLYLRLDLAPEPSPDPNPGIEDNVLTSEMLFMFVFRRGGTVNYIRIPAQADQYANYEDGFIPANAFGVNDPAVDFWTVPAVRRFGGVSRQSANVFELGGAGSNVDDPSAGFDLLVDPGDKILDEFGVVYTVTGADEDTIAVEPAIMRRPFHSEYPTAFWFVPRGKADDIRALSPRLIKKLIPG